MTGETGRVLVFDVDIDVASFFFRRRYRRRVLVTRDALYTHTPLLCGNISVRVAELY